MKIRQRLVMFFVVFMLIITSSFTNVTAVFATVDNKGAIEVESNSARPGGILDVNIVIKDNPGVLGATITVTNDEQLTLTDAKSGMAFDKLSFGKPGKFGSTNIFTWDGETISGGDIKDGIILTLTYKIAEDANIDTSYPVNISYEFGDIIDSDMNPVELDITNGSITVINYTPGDVNEDGKINATDCVYIRRYITGGYNLNVFTVEAADVNADGKINSTDIILVRRYIIDGCTYNPDGYGVILKSSTNRHIHNMEEIKRVDATCIKDGNIAYWFCGDCGRYFTDAKGVKSIQLEDIIIKATGHTEVIDPAVAPTNTSTGLTEGSHCLVCNTVIKEQQIVPKLEKNEYSITYHIANNDKYLQSLDIENPNASVYISEDGLVLQDIIVDGYEFKGWYTAQSGGERVSQISIGESGNKTLYAQWDKVEYTVTFDSPDVPVEAVVYTVDKGITLTNPSWFGYTFVGWSNDNGFIVSSIKPGTTGNITLHSNWTSNRNKTTSYKNYGQPLMIEDNTSGQFLFVYDIGKIDNVPLSQIEYIGNTQNLNINKEYEITNTITSDKAETIANTVSNATTRSSGWTLSKEWNSIYESGSEYEDTRIKSSERVDSQGNVIGGNYFVSNSAGGSSYVSNESGGSSAQSSKVTTENSYGINSSYDRAKETYIDGKLGVSNTTKVGGKLSFPVEIFNIEAGISNSTTVSAEVEMGRKDSESYHVDSQQSNYIGTVSDNSSSSYYKTVANQSSTWNSTSGYEKSYQTSRNSQISSAISEQISKTTSYNVTDSLSEQNSQTETVAGTDTRSNEYSSTLKYSEGTSTTTKKHISFTSDRPGYYRLVTAGTVHVYGVVGYDVATASYYTYTFNVLDDERHEYLDYSKDNANFNDCENGLVTFEVPYEVNEYILGVTGKTPGLEFDLNGKVTAFESEEGFEGTVTIPQYYSVNNGDGTYCAYKTTSFDASVFKGNTEIKTVVLPVYVTEIPDNAFEGCTNLERVIAFGVTKIGNNAFKDCTSLNKFSFDNLVTSIGNNAFENVPEIAVMAANTNVADSVLVSGVDKLTLNLSKMNGSYDNKKIAIDDSTEYFALISDGASYKNLQIDSDAKETFLSNMILIDNSDTPLKLNSQKVTLGRVIVKNSSGFALVLEADNTDLSLFGTISLGSVGENAILSKNVSLNKANPEVIGAIETFGDMLVCGNVKNASMLNVHDNNNNTYDIISEDEFSKYLTSSKITFDANGGELVSATKTVYYGQTYGEMPVPTKVNYVFDGWYSAASGGTKVTSDTIVTALGNKTLYAHWTPKSFKVTFNANGGNSTTTEKTIVFGDSYGSLPSPTRDYYTFNGWYTAASGGIEVTSEIVPTETADITLYAHWTENPVSSWILESNLPSNVQVVNQKWTYDLTEKTTSSSSSLSGWTKYDTTWAWGAYGNWSGWSRNKYTASDSRQVESRSVYDHTEYHYYRWTNSNHTACYTYKNSSTGATILEEKWFTFKLPTSSLYGSPVCYNGSDTWGNGWVPANSTYNYSVDKTFTKTVNRTEYRYRDRSKVYTYHYKKTTSKESETEVKDSDSISNVKKYVQYRVK